MKEDSLGEWMFDYVPLSVINDITQDHEWDLAHQEVWNRFAMMVVTRYLTKQIQGEE